MAYIVTELGNILFVGWKVLPPGLYTYVTIIGQVADTSNQQDHTTLSGDVMNVWLPSRTRDNTHRRTNFTADFLDNGGSKRRV